MEDRKSEPAVRARRLPDEQRRVGAGRSRSFRHRSFVYPYNPLVSPGAHSAASGDGLVQLDGLRVEVCGGVGAVVGVGDGEKLLVGGFEGDVVAGGGDRNGLGQHRPRVGRMPGSPLSVDPSDFVAGGRVAVTDSCEASFADLAMLVVPGVRTFEATAIEVIGAHPADSGRLP